MSESGEDATSPADHLASATAALRRLGFSPEQIAAFRRPEPRPYPSHWLEKPNAEDG